MESKIQMSEVSSKFNEVKTRVEELKDKSYEYYATKPIEGIGLIPEMSFTQLIEANSKITKYFTSILMSAVELGVPEKNIQADIDGFNIKELKEDLNTRAQELRDEEEIKRSLLAMKLLWKYLPEEERFALEMERVDVLLSGDSCNCNCCNKTDCPKHPEFKEEFPEENEEDLLKEKTEN